jgi:hypothetical protein
MLLLSVFGALAGMDIPRIGADLPTPWVGLWERINIYATMLWIGALAVSLLRAQGERPREPSVGVRVGRVEVGRVGSPEGGVR